MCDFLFETLFFSLLAPAIEQAENQEFGSLSWLPVAVGIALGAGFVAAAGNYSLNLKYLFFCENT